ncbi:cyclopropane-fatty-acyl-phospholipid synthase family protein [Aquincola sp. MAHUQ-54]|uniref:Cyclopropane-fatty-acyl-phospholipid synthase family protein n=1 Tax=Aquincola agrisoli TaxID=3119538 RepID=A0AAW9Q9F8_9BURK
MNIPHSTAALAAGTGRRPLAALLRRPLHRLLRRLLRAVHCGALVVHLPDGRRLEARGAADGPHAALTLHRWRALARLALAGDIGLAEAYRDGDWSTDDLPALLEFGLRNEAAWGGALDAPWPVRALFRLAHRARANTRRGSRQNISFHYDLGNGFYAQWLDPELIYSSALYAPGVQSLEEAQAAKLERVLALLQLDRLPGPASILEIGCGWGALAAAMARRHPAAITGLTLSAEQLAHAGARLRREGLDGQVELRLQDYRDVEGEHDRIVSIEMLEAVGERYWPVYFETLRERLRPGGIAVLQVITIADAHFEHYRRGADFIQRFIFPGGMLPSVAALRAQAGRAGLSFTVAESFGPSYAATLAEWRRRFLQAWPAIEALGFDEPFKRLWAYYLGYCEAGFRTGRVDVGLYVLTKDAAA